MLATEIATRVKKLAEDMAGYIHHSGYPVYDGGHSEPESACQHPDCVAVREFSAALEGRKVGEPNAPRP